MRRLLQTSLFFFGKRMRLTISNTVMNLTRENHHSFLQFYAIGYIGLFSLEMYLKHIFKLFISVAFQ
jgi:hypothetical protein